MRVLEAAEAIALDGVKRFASSDTLSLFKMNNFLVSNIDVMFPIINNPCLFIFCILYMVSIPLVSVASASGATATG